jgi:hypothetical protein
MDASDFLKNPVVFFNHNYDQPIGKAEQIRKGDGQVTAVTRFPERPESHVGEWFPDTVLSMFVAGVLRGFSVGFDPMAGSPRKATKADTDKYGEGVRQVFSKWKLFEYSVAPLPCNQDALALSVNKGILSPDRAADLFGVEIDPTPEPTPEPVKRRTVVLIERPRVTLPKRQAPSVAEQAAVAIKKLRGEMYR